MEIRKENIARKSSEDEGTNWEKRKDSIIDNRNDSGCFIINNRNISML